LNFIGYFGAFRLSRSKRVVENAFGMLAQRFQVFLTTMQHNPETIQLIVKACMLLHNLMRTRYPTLQNQDLDREENLNRDLVPGAWRQGVNLADTIAVAGPNAATREAKKQRNIIKHWVASPAGSVPWQDAKL
jgi:hypothetical protein